MLTRDKNWYGIVAFAALSSLYLPKSFNFMNASFACYKQKCKLARYNMAHPVLHYLIQNCYGIFTLNVTINILFYLLQKYRINDFT